MKTNTLTLVSLVYVGFLVCFFCYFYISNEQPVYMWDYAGYFSTFLSYGEQMKHGSEFFQRLHADIRHSDYNGSSIFFLMPFYYIFGGDRSVYVMAIVIVYLIPAVFVEFILSQLVLDKISQNSKYLCALIIGSAFLSWPFWMPTIRGQPDIAGLVPLGLATILIIKSDFLTKSSIKTSISVGILIWAAFLFRRWYAYASISLIFISFIFFSIRVFESRLPKFEAARRATTFVFIGAATGICLWLFQAPLAWRILHTSYVDLNAAYQTPFFEQVGLLQSIYGPFIAVFFLIGLVTAIIRRNHAVMFLGLLPIFYFLLFSRVQQPEYHHLLPFYFWLFPTFIFGIVSILEFSPSELMKGTGAIVALALMLSSFCVTFSSQARDALKREGFLLPSETVYPLEIDNYTSYASMVADLKRTLKNEDQIGVVASDPALSSSLLISIDRSLSSKVTSSSELDVRNDFTLAPFKARFIVITDPVTASMPTYQRSITVPVQMILENRDLGTGYKKILGPYPLSDGFRGYVYERTRPLSDDDIKSLVTALQKYYPNWKLQSDGFIRPNS